MKSLRMMPLLLAVSVVPAVNAADDNKKDAASSDCYELQKLTYMDSKVFDAGMDQVIRRGCSDIQINVYTPVSLDKLPERLDNWFERIITAGGGMAVVPASAMPVEETGGSRGLETAALDQAAEAVQHVYSYVKKIKDKRKEAALQKAAGDYTAVVYFDEASGAVKGIRLVRGEEPLNRALGKGAAPAAPAQTLE